MPQSSASKPYTNFVAGLVTEANELSHPENAAIDMVNLDLQEDGSLTRRAGLAFDSSVEEQFPALGTSLFNIATNVFKWEAVNGDPSLNIAMIQIGDELSFHYIADNRVTGDTPAADPITLSNTVRTSSSTAILRKSTDVQAVSGGGRLYVVGKYIDPFVLTFTKPAVALEKGTVAKTVLNLKIRDFKIVGEGEYFNETDVETSSTFKFSVAGEKRQNFLTGAMTYNLANQGWPSIDYYNEDDDPLFEYVADIKANVSTTKDPNSSVAEEYPITYTREEVGFFPTIYDSFHEYQSGGGDTVEKQTAYSPWWLVNDYTGNTPAPRGHLIREAFYISRKANGLSWDLGQLTPTYNEYKALFQEETAQTRPEAVAFYAGRVWYAGLQGDQYTNNVYYSQVIGDDLVKASKCYQEADPTAENINELVATDGGVFNLEEVGKIYRMAPIGPSLAIIADNGVWVISGDGEFSSFSATSFSVRKITDQGAINEKTVVFAKDAMYYWGETALYRILIGQQGALVAQDLSSSSIKSLYQQTSGFGKQYAFSVFDEGANKILWFYQDLEDQTGYESFLNKAFNKVLYFDISLGAYGKYELGITQSTFPVGAISAESSSSLTIVENVTQDGEVVVDSLGDPVTIESQAYVRDISSIKIMTVQKSGDNLSYRFSSFSNILNFTDWNNTTDCYVETGFDSIGDIIGKSKKAPIVQVHMRRTEDGFELDGEEYVYSKPSGCLMSYKWDWGETYTGQMQVYKLIRNYVPEDGLDQFDYNRSVVTSRNRIRGRGVSLGLRFDAEAGKDMKLLGYGIVYTARRRP